MIKAGGIRSGPLLTLHSPHHSATVRVHTVSIMSTVDDSQPILTPDEGTRKFFYDKTESLIAEAVEACSELADPFDMSVRGRLTQAESILKFTKDLSVPAVETTRSRARLAADSSQVMVASVASVTACL